MRRAVLVGVLAFSLGFLTAFGYVVVSGGWYEYRIATTGAEMIQLVNDERWQLVSVDGVRQLRRARLRLP